MEINKSLPEELILEILLRLPVKSLVRFKCICKSWFSFISDPHFGKSHFELSAAPTSSLIYLELSCSEARTLDFDASLHDDSVVSKFSFPLPLSLYGFYIRGSCRGFLLLENYPSFFLWNPSTGELELVFYSAISSKCYNSVNAFKFLYGFGYDAYTDDYLIVIVSLRNNLEADGEIHLEFFSLRTNSWKKVEVTYFPYACRRDQSGLLFNGAIHWVVFRDYEDSDDGVILAFDLTERKLSEVPMPCSNVNHFYDLRVIEGCLGLCYGGEFAEVWVMKEYKVQSSWTMSVDVLEVPTIEVFPVCLTKRGEIVGLDQSDDLVKLNVEGELGELLEHGAYCHDGQIAMYTESLLLLPPIDAEEAKDVKQQ